jgi:predicted PurR-regulated permease PerM
MKSNPGEQADPLLTEDWGSRAHVHTLVMFAITLIALYLSYSMAAPFLPALAWALAITLLVLPFQRLLEARIPRPGVVAAITVCVAAVIVVAPVVLLTYNLITEAADAAQSLQAQVESGQWRQVVAPYPRLLPVVDLLDRQFNLPQTVATVSGYLTGVAGEFLRGSLQQAVMLLLTFYLLFYFLRDRNQALDSIRRLSPLSKSRMERLFRLLGDTLHATLFGTFVVAIVQGALGGLMFWWLGLPSPLLWGVVMGMLAIIPVLGAFVIWIPAALFLLATEAPGKALVLAIWGTVVVGGIDNLLYPMLVGNRMRMHTVLVFISIVGGLFVFGAAGLILGPIVLTITTVLLEVWRHQNADPIPVAVAAAPAKATAADA